MVYSRFSGRLAPPPLLNETNKLYPGYPGCLTISRLYPKINTLSFSGYGSRKVGKFSLQTNYMSSSRRGTCALRPFMVYPRKLDGFWILRCDLNTNGANRRSSRTGHYIRAIRFIRRNCVEVVLILEKANGLLKGCPDFKAIQLYNCSF